LAIEDSKQVVGPLDPPYVLTFPASTFKNTSSEDAVSTILKRKRNLISDELRESHPESVLVESYMPENMGPYPEDIPKRNLVRFTNSQSK
jgi:intron-binding protein aquarius